MVVCYCAVHVFGWIYKQVEGGWSSPFAGANHVLKKKQYNKVKVREKYKKMGKILVS